MTFRPSIVRFVLFASVLPEQSTGPSDAEEIATEDEETCDEELFPIADEETAGTLPASLIAIFTPDSFSDVIR